MLSLRPLPARNSHLARTCCHSDTTDGRHQVRLVIFAMALIASPGPHRRMVRAGSRTWTLFLLLAALRDAPRLRVARFARFEPLLFTVILQFSRETMEFGMVKSTLRNIITWMQ